MAEITVYDFPGLRSALAGADYNVIRLGANITFSSGGITVPRSKGDVLLDGQGFQITDYSSVASADTIRYADLSGGAMTFTVQNVIWNGKNYFGVVYAPDTANFNNFTLMLDNVQYTGPQPVYNRRGTTYYIDSAFSIERNSGASVPQELGEVHHAVIRGTVAVSSQTTTTSVLWFLHASASLTVEENAVFTVNVPGNYMFYTDSTPPPSMLFKANSVTKISTEFGLFYNASATYHMASSFVLEAGASFTSAQSVRSGVPTFKCRDTFVMNEGSSLYMTAEPYGTAALMYFSARATLSFNNPKSVVLYNNGGRVFDFDAGTTASPNAVNIDTELLNMWINVKPFPDAGGFDDTPARALSKADGANISAVINTNTTTATAINSNIGAEDAGYPMTTATFNVMQARVISMGRLNLAAEGITDISPAITGMTEPSAKLRVSYGGATAEGAADAAGTFSLPLLAPIPAGTVVAVGANWKFLTKFIQVISTGSVSITYLPDLIFKTFFVPNRSGIVKRRDPAWYMEVTDTRQGGGSDWSLYAWIPAPLSSGSDTLDNALTFNTATYSDIMSAVPTLIRRGNWTEQGAVTTVTWPELEGFLLRVNPDYLYNPGKYTAEMDWEVRTDSGNGE